MMEAAIRQSRKRTLDMFPPKGKLQDEGKRIRLSYKMKEEYAAVAKLPPVKIQQKVALTPKKIEPVGVASQLATMHSTKSVYIGPSPSPLSKIEEKTKMQPVASKWPRPEWHAPWKNYRVLSGHLGWVRCVAFEPNDTMFYTGSADRTVKIWETATGRLKLTLTGHIGQVRGLAVLSEKSGEKRSPYLFSAGDDKQVKCWDLEQNKVIRDYHGHLSGVYSLASHPTLDLLFSGGRDSVCRVWDIRTRAPVFVLSGHKSTVCSIATQATNPQVITGSQNSTIKFWDLTAGKNISTLTHHKKSVRALAIHSLQNELASASADNIKKFSLPDGRFAHNMLSQQHTIINCMALNSDENVLVTGGDNGGLFFWDWATGYNFQQVEARVQPGSLDCEAGIYGACFSTAGTRLVTCEADKTIKMWKPDLAATPITHPISFKPPISIRRF